MLLYYTIDCEIFSPFIFIDMFYTFVWYKVNRLETKKKRKKEENTCFLILAVRLLCFPNEKETVIKNVFPMFEDIIKFINKTNNNINLA
jgi:hypothetical protein